MLPKYGVEKVILANAICGRFLSNFGAENISNIEVGELLGISPETCRT